MDLTWSDSAIYACPCGTFFAVTYWRWVDATARPELARSVETYGPYEGSCPDCGRAARSHGPWLHLDPPAEMAALRLGPERRGEVTLWLQRHLLALEQRAEAIPGWLLQPRVEFVRSPAGNSRSREVSGELRLSPAPSGQLAIHLPPPPPSAALQPNEGDSSSIPGVPQIIGTDMRSPRSVSVTASLGVSEGWLSVLDGRVVVEAPIRAHALEKWAEAKLDARPIHLADFTYPLVGVRILGAFMGQRGCIDAVLDPRSAEAADVAGLLARKFEVELRLSHDGGATPRTVARPGLEPNAALCLESARQRLAAGSIRGTFEQARQELASAPLEARLAAPAVGLSEGAYRHIVGAQEAQRALDELDRVSRKEYLSRLLEVEGFAMGEYDALRRRILEGALVHGLVAPRRFWRRVVAAGLAGSLYEYAHVLAENREMWEGEEGDLEPEAARRAWEGILDLCQRKDIDPPDPLRRALELGDGVGALRSRAAGVIGNDRLAHLRRELEEPGERLRAASEMLAGGDPNDLDRVLAALEAFDVDELLALLPDLSELGSKAAPALLPLLKSSRRELRQSAAILLGFAADPVAIDPLVDRMLAEPTEAWVDLARAVGSFGPPALRRLCHALRRESGAAEARALERVAWAMAEVALSDARGGRYEPTPARDAVAALVDAGDPRVGAAARSALATLSDVREHGATIRGERPLHEVTEVGGFARRAYEAILVPELEVEAEA